MPIKCAKLESGIFRKKKIGFFIQFIQFIWKKVVELDFRRQTGIFWEKGDQMRMVKKNAAGVGRSDTFLKFLLIVI